MKVLITLMATAAILFGSLTEEQINKVKITYQIGKSIKASDGMTFETALSGMFGQESSYGIFIIGDKYDENGRLKDVYESSLGGFQVKLSTAQLTIKKFPKLYKKYKHLVYNGEGIYENFAFYKKEYKKVKSKIDKGINYYLEKNIMDDEDFSKILYYKEVLNNKNWINRFNNGDQKAIKTFAWAKKELAYHNSRFNNKKSLIIIKTNNEYSNDVIKYKEYFAKYKEYKEDAEKDSRLINKLLNDHKFGAEIAGHYLLLCYEEALKKGFGNSSYWKAIGKYNGGWNNSTYYNKVKERFSTIEQLKRDGLI